MEIDELLWLKVFKQKQNNHDLKFVKMQSAVDENIRHTLFSARNFI